MLLDVMPLSLSTNADGRLMKVLIKRDTMIPTESLKDCCTIRDGQRRMTINMYKGKRSCTKDNRLLGLFEMVNLPPTPRGRIEVRIIFKVKANGLLEVTAQNLLVTKSMRGIKITSKDGRLSPREVETMVREAARHASKDRREPSGISSRNRLELQLYYVSSMLRESTRVKNKLDYDHMDDLKMLIDVINETMEWLDIVPAKT
jgi:molecular chaperone DnaK (HSP70)